jgi:hypothetical protein
MDVEEGRPPGGLRITVGHAGRDGFVQGQHVMEPVVPGQGADERELGGSRVPENMPDPLVARTSSSTSTPDRTSLMVL